MKTIQLDSAWIAANPAPVHGGGTTKDSRGHVVLVGGGRAVPGAPRLTAEAAFRAGAGKVQIATIGSAAIALGVLLPEAGILPLLEDDEGEIVATVTGPLARAIERCDVALVGPGMGTGDAAREWGGLISGSAPGKALVLDAAAIAGAALARERAGPLILTPNHDEMARLLEQEPDAIANDPAAAARTATERFGAIVVLKGSDTVITAPGEAPLHYPGGGVGLATGGSGDVLAGAIAGLLSRGTSPLIAAGWGVWLHGQAARRLAAEPGPIGFLARELPDQFPRLLPQ